METKINIYIDPQELEDFKIRAIQKGVKITEPEETQMVNFSGAVIAHVIQQMVGAFPDLIFLIRTMINLGKRVVASPKKGTNLEIKTDEEIKEAVSLKMDIWFFKMDFQSEKTTNTKTVTLKEAKLKAKK